MPFHRFLELPQELQFMICKHYFQPFKVATSKMRLHDDQKFVIKRARWLKRCMPDQVCSVNQLTSLINGWKYWLGPITAAGTKNMICLLWSSPKIASIAYKALLAAFTGTVSGQWFQHPTFQRHLWVLPELGPPKASITCLELEQISTLPPATSRRFYNTNWDDLVSVVSHCDLPNLESIHLLVTDYNLVLFPREVTSVQARTQAIDSFVEGRMDEVLTAGLRKWLPKAGQTSSKPLRRADGHRVKFLLTLQKQWIHIRCYLTIRVEVVRPNTFHIFERRKEELKR